MDALKKDRAPDGPLDQQKGMPLKNESIVWSLTAPLPGLLSVIGDPIGSVAGKVVKPLGSVTGAIGNPTGEALLKSERVAKHEKGYSDEDNDLTDKERPGGEKIGGNEQNDKNPLGL